MRYAEGETPDSSYSSQKIRTRVSKTTSGVTVIQPGYLTQHDVALLDKNDSELKDITDYNGYME